MMPLLKTSRPIRFASTSMLSNTVTARPIHGDSDDAATPARPRVGKISSGA
jgi:hypothetical protein